MAASPKTQSKHTLYYQELRFGGMSLDDERWFSLTNATTHTKPDLRAPDDVQMSQKQTNPDR